MHYWGAVGKKKSPDGELIPYVQRFCPAETGNIAVEATPQITTSYSVSCGQPL